MEENRFEKVQRMSVLLFLLIPMLMYAQYYMRLEIPGNADLVQYFSARKQFIDGLMTGELPQWNGYLANGMPMFGNFYVISILLSFLPLKEYIYAYFIVHLFIGSYFFYKYLRECQCSYKVSMIFAIIFECSIQINGVRKGHPTIIASICLFPLIMFLVKKFLNTRENKWLCLSAAVAAMQATIGQQYSVYAVMVLFVYILTSCICEKFSVKDIVKKGMLWLGTYIGIFAYALLPNLSTMSEYNSFGSVSTSYDTFRSYSIHPMKLIQMIIPRFFGDVYQGLGIYYSSEMDIELYLGIFVLLFAISFVVFGRKKWNVKLEFACVSIAFLYAAVAHIPIVNQIVYKLPVLGGFRCAGRMLYIFYFFMFSMAAQGLHNAMENGLKNEQLQFMKKYAGYLFAGLGGLGVIRAFVMRFIATTDGKQIKMYSEMKNMLLLPLVFTGMIYCVLYIVQRGRVFNRELIWSVRSTFLGLAVMVITLMEVLPFSLITFSTPLAQFSATHETTKKLSEDIRNYKIWDAFDNVDGAHESIISQNRNAVKEIASITSYTAYNNPLMFKYFKNLGNQNMECSFNYSGLFTGSLNVRNNVLLQNDLLSMLGVKYLIDSSHVIESTDGKIYNSNCDTSLIKRSENVLVNCENGQIGVLDALDDIEPNKCYKIKIEVNEEYNSLLTGLIVDLWGGDSYDSPEQEKQFYITENDGEYVAYLYSADADKATEDISIRILARSENGQVLIDQYEISKVEPIQGYQYWATDQYGMKIYENADANDILYFPREVVHKDNFDDMYQNYEEYELSEVAYTGVESKDLKNVNSQVEVLDRTSNTLTAKVNTDEDTYLCFSQNYSRNWSVEIDGKEQNVDMVNGLIMGIQIPKGEHMIVFRYQDNAYVLGYAITLLTIAGLLVCYILSRKKNKFAEAR